MSHWRSIQRKNFSNVEALADFLEWDSTLLSRIIHAPRFPLNLPLRIAEKIEKNTLDDPLLRQFIPLKEEGLITPHFKKDPVDDQHFRKEKKLLHKYQGRALLVTTSACAMNCRFCFRRNFDYESFKTGFTKEIQRIAQDTTLKEIILSGGDPLSLSDPDLFSLIDALVAIPHVERVRFHTRFIIGIPERITSGFIEKLSSYSKQMIFIVHCNHEKELDSDVIASLKKLQKIGPVLTQTVLLAHVNDSTGALYSLFNKLISHGVMPYYLHQLDQVQGSMHYEVTEEKGHMLIEELKALLPGYGVPKYVREIAYEKSKTELHPFESAQPQNMKTCG